MPCGCAYWMPHLCEPHGDDKVHYGFLADELQKLFPHKVRPDAEGRLFVDLRDLPQGISPRDLVAAIPIADIPLARDRWGKVLKHWQRQT
jgi:hypothetical protein